MHNLFQYGFFVCLFVGAVCLFVFNYLFCFVFLVAVFFLCLNRVSYISVSVVCSLSTAQKSQAQCPYSFPSGIDAHW